MRKVIIHNHLPPRAKDTNAFEHAVSREQEEKNRDEAYRKAGITRVNSDAKPSFEEWKKLVDRACQQKSGMSIDDLPDCPFLDWYDSGVAATSAAARCLKAAKSEGAW